MVPLLAVISSAAIMAAPPTNWAELLAAPGLCVSRIGNSGGIIKTFSCVDVHAANAGNQLFAINAATGEWRIAGGQCVGTAPCAGETGLCLVECANATRWQAKR